MAQNTREIVFEGGPKITVVRTVAPPKPDTATGSAVVASLGKQTGAAPASTAAGSSTAAPGGQHQTYGFFCSLCKMGFHDTLALALHKRSRKHREAAGLNDPEADEERRRLPSVEELRAFIAAKAAEREGGHRQAGAADGRPAKAHRSDQR